METGLRSCQIFALAQFALAWIFFSGKTNIAILKLQQQGEQHTLHKIIQLHDIVWCSQTGNEITQFHNNKRSG